MKIKNLTPHPIAIYACIDGVRLLLVTLRPEEQIYRLAETDTRVTKTWIQDYKCPNTALGDVDFYDPNNNIQMACPIVQRAFLTSDLPPAEENTLYVVSLPALMGLRAAGCDRKDILAPDTGSGKYGAVRDENGQIMGVQRLLSIGPFPDGLLGGDGWTVEEWQAANQ